MTVCAVLALAIINAALKTSGVNAVPDRRWLSLDSGIRHFPNHLLDIGSNLSLDLQAGLVLVLGEPNSDHTGNSRRRCCIEFESVGEHTRHREGSEPTERSAYFLCESRVLSTRAVDRARCRDSDLVFGPLRVPPTVAGVLNAAHDDDVRVVFEESRILGHALNTELLRTLVLILIFASRLGLDGAPTLKLPEAVTMTMSSFIKVMSSTL